VAQIKAKHIDQIVFLHTGWRSDALRLGRRTGKATSTSINEQSSIWTA
jgi:hypothetical protein